MNIAFSALLIVLLALPGIILIRVFGMKRGRPVAANALTDELPFGIVASAVLHSAWVLLFNLLGKTVGTYVDLQIVLRLLTAQYGKDDVEFADISAAITSGYSPAYIFAYFISLYLVAYFLGWRLAEVFSKDKQMETAPFLRGNHWYYLLRGESPAPAKADDEILELVRFTAVVEDYIYWGLVEDFTIDSDGELESIVVKKPSRRKIGDGEQSDAAEPPQRYKIRADYLVLKYSECKNIAVLNLNMTDMEIVEEFADGDNYIEVTDEQGGVWGVAPEYVTAWSYSEPHRALTIVVGDPETGQVTAYLLHDEEAEGAMAILKQYEVADEAE